MNISKLNRRSNTLLSVLAQRAAGTPDLPAFEFNGRAYSFAWLWENLNAFAASLQLQGLARADRVLVAMPNSPEFFIAFYGIQRAGGIPVPVHPNSGDQRIASLAVRCGADRIVLAADRPALTIPLTRTDPDAQATPAAPFPAIAAESIAYLQFTSGTTGEPKAVPIRHVDVLTNIRQMIAGMAITAEEVFVSWLPAFHDMGLVLMTMAPFYLGARLVLLPTSFVNLRGWLAAIEEVGGTFTASPDFGYRLAMRFAANPAEMDLSSLRVALNAAEPVRQETVLGFEKMFGLDRVMTVGYGLAEATVGVSMTPPGSRVRFDPGGFASTGLPFPDVEIAIINSNGDPAACGDVGEILVRSPANMRGYFDGSALGRDKPGPDAAGEDHAGPDARGFIRTGDMGYLDEQGELFVIGRLKDMLKHAGQTLAPREVEAALDDHAGIRSTAAISADLGGLSGEQIVLICELAQRGDIAIENLHTLAVSLVEKVHGHLGFRPGRLYLVKARTIPLSENGKMQRGKLKVQFQDGSLRAKNKLIYPDY